MRIDQFLPCLAPHDAIGAHVLNVRRALRQAGFESDIWAEEIRRPMQGEAGLFAQYVASRRRADIAIYHLAFPSRIGRFLAERPEPLVVEYHNMTPSRFFARWDPVVAARMDRGRIEVRELAPLASLALADSPYNETELLDAGYRRTAVSPILVDYEHGDAGPDPREVDRLRRERAEGGAHWLFVGRLAPNKCQHDVIGAFAVYRRLFDGNAKLRLVGGTTAARYEHALRQLTVELDLGDAVEFAGSVPRGHLRTAYQTTDVLVCLSEHEGFCAPLIEAMAIGVPVVAYAAAAVPDTVGDACVLLDDKDPLLVACAVDQVLSDGLLRAELIDAGRARAEQFSLERTSKQLVGHLSGLTGRPSSG